MLNSIEQLTLKTGQEVIIMSHRDIIDTIRDTLGDPLANLVAAELVNTPNIYYDKEACKPDVEPKVGDLAILKGDVWNTNFKVGSVVQVLGVTDDKQMVLIELINLDRVLYTTSVRAEILDIIGTSIRQEEV